MQLKQFRPLTDDECRILYWRHYPHEGNVTPQEYLDEAHIIGALMAPACLDIAAAYASPQPRSYLHLYYGLCGYGRMVEIRTLDGLDALVSEGPNVTNRLKAAAAAAGKDPEEYFLTDPGFRELRYRRGRAGVSALWEIASRHPGKTVLVGGHGGSRMEVSIAALAFRAEQYPVIIGRGKITELIVNGIAHGGITLIEEEYQVIL